MFPDVAAAPPSLGSPQHPWQPPWQSRMVSHPCAQLAHDVGIFLTFQSQARFQNDPLSSRTEVSIEGMTMAWALSFPWLSLAVPRSKLMRNTQEGKNGFFSTRAGSHFPVTFVIISPLSTPGLSRSVLEAPCIILSSSSHVLKCQKNLGSNFNMMTN